MATLPIIKDSGCALVKARALTIVMADHDGSFLRVFPRYVSSAPLASVMRFIGEPIQSLGLIPGTYEWSWGDDVTNDNIIMIVDDTPPPPVPVPMSWMLLGLGMVGCGAVAVRSRRRIDGVKRTDGFTRPPADQP